MVLRSKTYFLLTFILFNLAACGGGSSSSSPASQQNPAPDPNNSNQEPVTTNEQPNTDSQGQYDLAQYLFPTDVVASIGDFSFTEKLYSQESGELVATLSRRFSNADGAEIEEYSFSDKIKLFEIKSTEIEETLLDLNNATRISARYANIGDTYMNADYTPPPSDPIGLSQNASCKLVNHLESFDLASAAGNFNLGSGDFEDVLEIDCVTSFISDDGQRSEHTSLKHYFVKGLGGIFSEGTVFLFGDVYIVDEY